MPEPETTELRSRERGGGARQMAGPAESLEHEVKAWVEKAGWRTRAIEKPINDRKIGKHTVPVLLMERDTVESRLESCLTVRYRRRGPSTSTWCRPTTTSPASTSSMASG